MELKKLLNTLLPFIGLVDSMYLMRIRDNPGVCEVTPTNFNFNIDCGAVATSEYSTILGIPLALIGIIYYIILVILFSLDQDNMYHVSGKSITLNRIIQVILIVATLFSMYLVILQFFIILSICTYCMASAVVTVFLLINNSVNFGQEKI